MDRGLYIAASGMLSEMTRQDLIANDLANASTAGYKADRPVQHAFGDMLLHNSANGQVIGPLGEGAQITSQRTDLTPAPLRETGQALDFAVQGEGYFGVQTAQGLRFTRNGAFQRGANGRLVDQMGNPVLDQNRRPVQLRADGTFPATGLGVFGVPNARKVGDSYFTGATGARAAGTAVSGSLEGSGVDPTRTMVDMLASLRAFESGQKAITTIDSTLEKAVTQVGNTNGA